MKIITVCELNEPRWFKMDRLIYSPDGLCPTIHTMGGTGGGGGNTKIKVLVDGKQM